MGGKKRHKSAEQPRCLSKEPKTKNNPCERPRQGAAGFKDKCRTAPQAGQEPRASEKQGDTMYFHLTFAFF